MNLEKRVIKEATLWPWIVASLVLALTLGGGAYLYFSRDGRVEKEGTAPVLGVATSWNGPKVPITLFFPSKEDGYLRREMREARQVQDKSEQLKLVVEELIKGPKTPNLVPSFPAGARVKGVYMDDKGVAYVNFSRELVSEHPGGAWTETQTIYSLTNTLAEDFPNVKAVRIMVEGAATPTIAGHIDTSRPFVPRQAMNRG